MPNLGTLLKSEIIRVARRALKTELDALRKASAGHRRDVAALKRQVAELTRNKKGLERQLSKVSASQEAPAGEEDGKTIRFSLKGFKTLRAKLGLSAADFGRLAGVSAQSVYNWEQGKAVPQRQQRLVLAELRSLGKRAAAARLEALG